MQQSLNDQVANLKTQGYTNEQIIAALTAETPPTPAPNGTLHKRVDAITAVVAVGLFLIALAVVIIVSNQWSVISAWDRIFLVALPVLILYAIAAFTSSRPEQDSVHTGTLVIATLLMPVLFGTMMVQLDVWPVFNASLFTWCSAIGWLLFYILEWTWHRQSVTALTLFMMTLTGIGLLVHYEPRDGLIPWIILAAGLVVALVGKLYGRKRTIGVPRIIYGLAIAVLAFPIASVVQLNEAKVDWELGAWILAIIGLLYSYASRFVNISTDDPRWQNDIAQLKTVLREGGIVLALLSVYTLLGSDWWYVWIVMAIGIAASLLSLALPLASLIPMGGLGILLSAFGMFSVSHGLWVPFVAALIGLILILSSLKIRINTFIPLGTFMVVVSAIVVSNEVFADTIGWPIGVFILGLFFIGLGVMLNRITHFREGSMFAYEPKAPLQPVKSYKGGCFQSCLFLLLLYIILTSLVRIL